MKLFAYLFVALFLVSSVFAADLCSDTDGGGAKSSEKSALENKGDVKYGITTQSDTCLTSEEGVSTNSSQWLKEYYCSSDQRRSDVYDCVKLGYSGCVNGECVGGSSSSSSSNTTTTTTTPVSSCGDEIVEKSKGEQCDPPNSICFGKSTAEYGTCQSDCTCKIAAAALQNLEEKTPVCGDGYKHSSEDCEEDANCDANHVCSSCKCVKQLTPEEIEAMKSKPKSEEKTETSEVSDDYDYDVPDLPEVEAKNFSDDPAIKATSGIAGFFKKIFGWIAGLFV